MGDGGSRNSGTAARFGLWAGPLLACMVFLLLPDNYEAADGGIVALQTPAKAAAAVAALMAVWWMTEAISVYATALLPLALFPLLGVADIKAAAASYGNPIIYLFLGGFILALALEKWGLHKRLALAVLARVGARPRSLVGAFMLVSALLSMWVTNTATTIMLLPVAVSVIRLLPDIDAAPAGRSHPFAVCLLLGIAYASSIGGMGTIIGTAPNVFVVSYLREQLGMEIGFLEWMRLALPLVVLFIPLAWLVLTGLVYKVSNEPVPGVARLLRDERDGLPPWSRGEVLTFCVFLLTAGSWISRPLLNKLGIGGVYPFAGLTDSGIAVLAAVVLFIVPVNLRRHEFLMDWSTAVRLPWGLLLLFGGGLALAAALVDTGFSAYIGNQAGLLGGWPAWAVVMLVTTMIVFLTELTSNTATTATFVPILLAVATGLGMAPVLLILPAAFAASCAFMLPVATPPNAIVFGSGLVTIAQMARAGFWLNVIAIFLITAVGYAIIGNALGVIV